MRVESAFFVDTVFIAVLIGIHVSQTALPGGITAQGPLIVHSPSEDLVVVRQRSTVHASDGDLHHSDIVVREQWVETRALDVGDTFSAAETEFTEAATTENEDVKLVGRTLVDDRTFLDAWNFGGRSRSRDVLSGLALGASSSSSSGSGRGGYSLLRSNLLRSSFFGSWRLRRTLGGGRLRLRRSLGGGGLGGGFLRRRCDNIVDSLALRRPRGHDAGGRNRSLVSLARRHHRTDDEWRA